VTGRIGIALAAAATLAVAAAAPARSAGGCEVSGGALAGVAHSHLVAVRGATLVYSVRSRQRDDWFACRRGSPVRAPIGSQNSFQKRNAEYGPSQTLSDLELAGDWVVVVEQTGVDETVACGKYQPSFCWNPDAAILAADASAASARPGVVARLVSSPTDAEADGVNYELGRVLLSAAGGIAWLEQAEPYGQAPPTVPWTYAIYGCVLADGSGGPTCAPVRLAASPTRPASLALSGTTLTWTADGQSQSASLS